MVVIRYTDIDTGNNLLDQSLENYLMYGYQPGGFLTAVLANDLRLAVSRGDHWNKTNLHRIVTEVVHKVPAVAQGNYSAVKNWCEDRDQYRIHYREQKEKEYTWRALKGEVNEKEYEDPPF
jgi:hypothetical protein